MARHALTKLGAWGIALAGALQIHSANAVGDDTVLNRFLSEYPRAARALEQRYSQAKGTALLTETLDQNTGRRRVDKATFAADHDWQKVSILHGATPGEKSNPSEVVYCIGPASGFMLERRVDSGEYKVASIEKTARLLRLYKHDFGRFLSAPYAILGMSVGRLMEKPTFRAVSAENVDGSGSLVRVHFQIGEGDPDEHWVELDSGRNWLIRSGELRPGVGRGRDVIRYRVDYGPAQGDVPVLKRVEYIDVTGLPTSCEFTELTFGPTPPTAFNMTAYGLPDLTKASSPRQSRIPWVVAVAAMCLALALVLKWVAGRSVIRTA